MGSLNQACDAAGGKIIGVIHEMFLVDSAEFFDGMHPSYEKKHELILARGKNLSERKKLLVENSEAIIVMPGGPGTYDELWEMACQRNLGMYECPIVCISSDGFYDNFKRQLLRAEKDKLMRLPASDIIYFCETAEEAVSYCEKNRNLAVKKELKMKLRHEVSLLVKVTRNLEVVGALAGGLLLGFAFATLRQRNR
tara:strand:+ start:248 stop:835 length:588 start_codon:yes stop_codon:yes gene_type:complete